MIDVCIVGAGLAGLSVAYRLPPSLTTVVIMESATKGNSWLAQGGIAGVLDPKDSVASHLEDTLFAGASHVDFHAAQSILSEGSSSLKHLLEIGFPVDRTSSGVPMYGREAAHSHNRILHAGGDQTGRLWMKHITKHTSHLTKIMNSSLHSLVIENGRCLGVRITTASGEIQEIYAKHVVLATGGVGGLFEISSNCESAIGTGLSAAFHAGANLVDLEFIQFHPTVAVEGDSVLGLITEAVRGAGAYFTTAEGTPLPIDPLAPRDQVARQVESYWQVGDSVYLDVSGIKDLKVSFPTIFNTLNTFQSQEVRQTKRIPVRPGAHFHMGGIETDLGGRTSIPGLYAVGEVACTGLHGANRLASNSLLECIVMGKRVAESVACGTDTSLGFASDSLACPPKQLQVPTQQEMTRYVGVARSRKLEQFSSTLPLSRWNLQHVAVDEISAIHRYTAASLIAQSASRRTESRGAHSRSDYPNPSDEWLGSVLTRRENELSLVKRQLDTPKVRISQ